MERLAIHGYMVGTASTAAKIGLRLALLGGAELIVAKAPFPGQPKASVTITLETIEADLLKVFGRSQALSVKRRAKALSTQLVKWYGEPVATTEGRNPFWDDFYGTATPEGLAHHLVGRLERDHAITTAIELDRVLFPKAAASEATAIAKAQEKKDDKAAQEAAQEAVIAAVEAGDEDAKAQAQEALAALAAVAAEQAVKAKAEKTQSTREKIVAILGNPEKAPAGVVESILLEIMAARTDLDLAKLGAAMARRMDELEEVKTKVLAAAA